MKTKELTRKEAVFQLLKAQFRKGNKMNFWLASIGSLGAAAANLVLAWLLQQIVDVITGGQGRFSLLQLMMLSLVMMLGIIVIAQVDRIFRPRFIERAMIQYKEQAFLEISKKSISTFAKENTATYISAFSNDIASIGVNYLNKIFILVEQVIFCIGAFLLMVYYSPILTVAVIVFASVPLLCSVLNSNRLAKEEQLVSDKNESLVATIKDVLNGFAVMKSFQAEKEIIELFRSKNRETEAAKCSRKRTELLIQLIGNVSALTAQFGVFLVGAYLALHNKGITVGVVIIFIQLMGNAMSPIQEIPQILANRKAAYALIDKLAGAISENAQAEGKNIENKLEDAIEVKHLSFGYDETSQVLRDISFRFEAGKSYAIVGGSGSGKSTLLNLLMGSDSKYDGEIRYDGEELRTVNLDCIYEMVSMVQQNVFVFDSTIRDNVTMFREFTHDKLQRALKMSGLMQLIEARGSEYKCGENGNGLSGGERQRISIARSLLRGAPVMLVDEATAALDAETACSITNSILGIPGLTRIVVTHRLEEALMKKYDKIFVMKNGSVQEEGTFDLLMEQKGYFYSLFTVAQ